VILGVDYTQRLEEIIPIACRETSFFTPENIRSQCSHDPGLIHALVNYYDNLHDEYAPLRLRLIVEGEPKQIFKVEMSPARALQIRSLSFSSGPSIRTASRRRRRLQVSVPCVLPAPFASLTCPIAQELCLGREKDFFFGIVNHSIVTLWKGQYKRGSHVRFDWRNQNNAYMRINPATHLFYHLVKASVG
jgi:hypothetical protein